MFTRSRRVLVVRFKCIDMHGTCDSKLTPTRLTSGRSGTTLPTWNRMFLGWTLARIEISWTNWCIRSAVIHRTAAH
jgi:hypothetical protein